jgi:hypothetical protein
MSAFLNFLRLSKQRASDSTDISIIVFIYLCPVDFGYPFSGKSEKRNSEEKL